MKNQEGLIRAMLDATFYDHPISGVVGHIQTHSAHVFLTGPFAYKVKKAVNLGFLDFSTLEKRRFFCEEELRLNRRFGSTLYRGLRPIVSRGGGFSFGENSDPANIVDYAVQMDQFDERDVFLSKLKREDLDEADMMALAGRIALLHRNADPASGDCQFKNADGVYSAAIENLDQVAEYAEGTETAELLVSARAWAAGAVERQRPLLDRRSSCGWVRECHGDLHLNNICMHRGRIELFDCIDFNRLFREIDVMYEIAFVVMDLEYHGARELAGIFLNEYLEKSGDYDGAALLPLYMHMRACVRGKVASILASEPEVSPAQASAATASARAQFAYAERVSRRTGGPLIIMCGISGSGKTSVGRSIATALGAVHVRTDVVRKHLHGVDLHARGGEIYGEETTAETYERVAAIGASLLSAGLPVVLDGTYARRSLRERALRLAKATGCPARIVHCHAPEDVLRRRVAKRQDDASDATPDVVDRQLEAFEALSPEEEAGAIRIDTASPYDVSEVVSRLLRGH